MSENPTYVIFLLSSTTPTFYDLKTIWFIDRQNPANISSQDHVILYGWLAYILHYMIHTFLFMSAKFWKNSSVLEVSLFNPCETRVDHFKVRQVEIRILSV